MIPDAERAAAALSEAKLAAQRLVDTLADRAGSGAEDPVKLAELAGQELEDYARTLLRLLITAADGALEADGAAWVQRLFHESIGEVGSALRDAIHLSAARHAVAQTLQRKVFEAETELRSALARSAAQGS